MATVVNFKRRRIIEPGVYADIKAKVQSNPVDSTYSNVCIIDSGLGAGWGGGAGVLGETANGLNAVYSFRNINDAKSFLVGGPLWEAMDYLFNPANGAQGVDTLFLVKAATTLAASMAFSFTGGGTNGGSFTVKPKTEGVVANGITNEKKAKGIIQIGAVTAGQNITINSNEPGVVALGSFTATTNVSSDARTGVINAINSGSTGYKAALQGTDIVVTPPANRGAAANSYTLSKTGTMNATFVNFAGGVDGTIVSIGYGVKMTRGIINTSKFVLEFYQGTYRGLDANGDAIDGLTPDQSFPISVAKSAEFGTVEELYTWMSTDSGFNAGFIVVNKVTNGTGAVDNTDYTNFQTSTTATAGYLLASGGTETYSASAYDAVLSAIPDLDNSFFLSTENASDAMGVNNTKLLAHVVNQAEFDKFIFIGGGNDSTQFLQTGGSLDIAKYFDNEHVAVVHSGFRVSKIGGNGTRTLSSFFHAANVLGRIAGLPPQGSATFKNIRANNFLHILGKTEREIALQSGVIHTRFVPQLGTVINQGISTLQRNTQLVNPDGTSAEISVMRIAYQLNKELTLNLRPIFIGGNLNTSSPGDVKAFIESYLLSKTATVNKDNLIISAKNVTVRQVQDYFEVSYGFVPNGPVNKIFVTGFIFDGNLSA